MTREHARDTDLYAVLGVTPEVDPGELTRAYRRRLRSLHPDTRTRARPDDADDRDASRDLRELLRAYQVLRDPVRRARYDAERRARAAEQERRDNGPRVGGPGPGPGAPVPVRHTPPDPTRWLLRVGPVRIHPRPPQTRPSDR